MSVDNVPPIGQPPERPNSGPNSLMDSEKTATGDTVTYEPENRPAEKERTVTEAPDGGYGWVCVAACALINAHTWGINSVRYILSSFHPS